jgi:hypothetical protein
LARKRKNAYGIRQPTSVEMGAPGARDDTVQFDGLEGMSVIA